MRKYLLPIICIICFACSSNDQKEDNQQPAVPEALQDHKEKKSFLSKERSPDDLVNELYEEKLNQSPGLQAIEEKIKELKEQKIDSTEALHVFKNKNQQYYQSAENHRGLIQDSSLKNEIDAALARSKALFENKIVDLERVESLFDKNSVAVADRHLVLKLLISLGMMEQYQKDNMPLSTSMNIVDGHYKKLIQKLDSAIIKNK